jgi:PBP1b-binding outer membrane lipoprotein LpoB
MKRLILTALLVLSVLLIAGCDKAELVPLTGSDPQVTTIYVDGRQAALSTLADTMVAVSGVQTDNGLFLHVGYNNLSQRLIDVAPEDISVQAIDRNGNTTNLRVYRAAEYVDQIRDARNAELFFRAFCTCYKCCY